MRDELSLSQLAEFFAVTRSAAKRLAGENLFVRSPSGRYDLKASAQKYTQHLRSAASNRSETPAAIATIRQKNALARLAELKAKRLSNELIEMTEAQKLLGQLASLWRAAFLSLPQRIRVVLKLGLIQERELEALIDRRLDELAEETEQLDPLKTPANGGDERKGPYSVKSGPLPRLRRNGNSNASRSD